jgi:hypothetical protein
VVVVVVVVVVAAAVVVVVVVVVILTPGLLRPGKELLVRTECEAGLAPQQI